MIRRLVRVEFRFPSCERETLHLPSFGEKLKLEREKRKISLEQISSSTKIGTRMLQALEEEKFSQLPGGIFNKGFVRAYARVVGLDEDQAVADYLQASGDAPRPELVTRDGGARDSAAEDTAARNAAARNTSARDEEHRISRLEAISDEPSKPLPWGLFAVILLVIALGLSLWSHRRREQERLAEHPAATRTVPPAGGSPSETARPSIDNASPASNSATSASNPPSTAGAPLVATPSEKTPTVTPNSAAASQNSSTAAAPSLGAFQVLIHAREESWVSVTVDGKPSGSEVLGPGSDRTYSARKDVVVKVGNAGAIDFQLDGKRLDVGGAYGEVKAVTIGHAGVIPSPAPPPTTP